MVPKQEYIEQLIEEYGDMVFRLAVSRVKSKEEAEDIFQEVFIKIYEKMPEFVSKEHEKYWIIRVTINLSKNILKSSWHRKVLPLDSEIKFEDKEERDVYFEVLRLPLKYRTILQLYYYESFKIDEIAEILKISPNTAKTRLRRAREKLKINLKGGFEGE